MKTIHGRKTALLLLAGGMLFPALSQAGNTVIDITGKVVASPCVINSGEPTLAVNIGNDIQADSLSTAGSASAWKDFTLKVSNCPSSTTSFNVTFSGTPDTDANYYRNTGDATNLAVELATTNDKTSLKNGTALKNLIIDTSTRGYDLLMSARAVSKGNVMPGSIASQVQLTFTYQ
ncbi:type 1 fimbrial protein [Salmonella enterica]|nr:type 1 fimbrial protein [Salmonella enterica]